MHSLLKIRYSNPNLLVNIFCNTVAPRRILQFVFHKLTGDKKGYQGGLRQLSGYGSSIQGVDGANRTDSGAAETDDQPDTDLR